MVTQTNTGKDTVKKMSSFFKGVRGELKKVSWPNRKELINYTIVVIAICAIIALVVGLFDAGFHRLLSLILR